jgi:F-type H+-transporting ATPase subunit b
MDATSLATFWAMVALLIFFGVIVWLKVPGKVGSAMDAKIAAIEAELGEARQLREEAAALLDAFRRKAADAELEAQSIIAEAKAEAERLTDETNRSLEDLIARRTRAAEAKIAQAEAQAVAEVRARAGDVAIAAAEKILAVRTAGPAGADLVAKGISEVAAKLN